ncbi:inositol phospholipid synthesis and fat-storage-inducing TM-domain-containing protein [Russula earlei]|uniref:Inositol phospholipid synthesis and fat-storage-inducing TM-domain-containing protein n=1 Tax=Russula earlei TaxID=71964 RepID=A0ACC0UEQ8_9AGAM|nr:inositol phospholipid synthesis and fat-storage-inducing TM-domain-containing protein [Russula earlei]
MSILDFRIAALILTTVAVAHGTYYSLRNSTYLDTSDPLLTSQPHPLAETHVLASKRSLLNILFLKWSWAWTTAAFLPLLFTSPVKRARRFLQWVLATGAWYILTSWFFGPSLLTRLIAVSGGECGLHVENTFIPISPTYCLTGAPVARSTHPTLFPVSLRGDSSIPRFRRGHDVSGHVFLLTLAALFLADQLRQTRSFAHPFALYAGGALLSLWFFSLWVTSMFFHAASEKLSGLSVSQPNFFAEQIDQFLVAVLGVTCFLVSQIPLWFFSGGTL